MMFAHSTNIELVPFRLRNDVHLMRKLWHMGTGLCGLFLYFINGQQVFKTANILMALGCLALILEAMRLRYPSLNRFALSIMRPVMRESEKNTISGFPYYAMGVALSLYLFPERLAILSVIFLVFADPISSYFGINFGKDKLLPNKSLQGSLAGFVTCYALCLIYGLVYSSADFSLLIFALFGGLIGALSEMLSYFKIDDNFTIPVFSGFGLTLINLILGIF
ncbi:MAG TPA: hypothetical protein DCY86_03640 [Bdellovibrionales bacterium]|nr:hypothetical protein [Bdellovibrionales bacterium]